MIFLTTDHTVTAVTTVKKISTFGKSHLTHFTTDAMFSGQRFAIIAMFSVERLRDFVCGEVA